jgi:hypothetical protein
MALSPNYNWSEPDNSSLVKDGAQAMRTLGDAIDTSVWNVGFGQAGKNKIINGNFSVNQRGFTSLTTQDFGFDRWINALSGATATYSAQAFTLGAAPVAGYEAKNFARLAVTVGNDNCRLQQIIEDVRTFAGQTVTVSFWAKGTNPTTPGNLVCLLMQDFGTGGSPSAQVKTSDGIVVLTANWTRYSFTFTLPSIAGKTLGTNNNSGLYFWLGQHTSVSTDAWTLDLWGVQVEYGSKATPFQTASGGSIQGELAMCQRYYYRLTPGAGQALSFGNNYNTIQNRTTTMFPVEMRIAPTALEQNGTANNYAISQAGIGSTVCSNVPSFGIANTRFATVTGQVASGLTAYNTSTLSADATNGATAYLGWSAEL